MTRDRAVAMAIGILIVLLSVTATGTGAAPRAAPPDADAAAQGAPPPYPTDGNGFDPANFGPDSASIDNRFLPLAPGTRYVYRGSSLGDEGNRIPHRVVFTVTDLTKQIAGVRTVVGWDRDFSEGTLEEMELIFLAQDVEGNVWHLGQYPERYSEGQFEGAAPFIVGYLEGVKAGTMMPAHPRVGDPAYSEGFAPAPYFWDDHAAVIGRGKRICVPTGCYDHVLVTKEFEPTKAGAFQLKYYAPHVGYVRVGWGGRNEDEREILVLVEVRHLDAGAMAKVRARALAMEARANVYGLTSPVEPPSPPVG